MSSRNFCGIFWRLAISAIRTGSPGRCDARSKIACRAYSPLTEMFIGVEGGITCVPVEIVGYPAAASKGDGDGRNPKRGPGQRLERVQPDELLPNPERGREHSTNDS